MSMGIGGGGMGTAPQLDWSAPNAPMPWAPSHRIGYSVLYQPLGMRHMPSIPSTAPAASHSQERDRLRREGGRPDSGCCSSLQHSSDSIRSAAVGAGGRRWRRAAGARGHNP